MVIIFYFSSVAGLKYSEHNVTEIILRKGAHFVEYSILVFLVWNILYNFHRISAKKSIIFSFLIVVLYAISDEFHQTLVFGRTGKVIDVVYDSTSALLILECIALFVFKKIKKFFVMAILITVAILAFIEYGMTREGVEINIENSAMEPIIAENIQQEELIEKEKLDIQEKTRVVLDSLPDNILIKVPFTTQAPFAKWDAYHEEACEEASLIMLKYYVDKKNLTPVIAEKEIKKMIAYEIKNYGDYKDSNARQIVQLAHDFYGLNNLKVVYDFSKEDLKKYLSLGNPIIVPAAGRLLGNPNFKAPGPLYHNLVLVGYDGETIIANDPGTRKGEGYTYNMDILYNAIHDFPGDLSQIEKGRKVLIVLE